MSFNTNKNVIIFNQDIEIHNIHLRAYDSKVSGRLVIDWIVEQYSIRENDNIDNPFTYSEDPKYIFNLFIVCYYYKH
ncbi:type ISP restriction/modification enzyme [Macrococcus epidermidis]|uniref:type ISP restriction/modification enzyme n=1 Tax=Macrococcus epidermidis TaxID=1902580 RepID=UPI001475896E